MDLYDVLSEGCHTPLNPEQIANLFQAGSLGPNEPCRQVGARSWRTLDELFPLLKYGPVSELKAQPDPEKRDWNGLLLGGAIGFAVALAIATTGFLYFRPVEYPARAARPASRVLLPVVARITPTPARLDRVLASKPSYSTHTYRDSTPDQHAVVQANLARLEQERRDRLQLANEKAAMADRMRRENEEQEKLAQRAAGTDFVVPLDEYFPISCPSLSATVKVHDNDVTSFDIWVNGSHYPDMPKRKGITHSGTDETAVYNNGRATLYYVWEISGRLNHCLLRVREN